MCWKGERFIRYNVDLLKENKKISKNGVIPNGWIKGRNKWKLLAINYEKKIENKQKAKIKNKKINTRIHELRELHEIYIKHGFLGVKNAGYKYSKPNLVSAFSKYLSEFIPQNGKKRGN